VAIGPESRHMASGRVVVIAAFEAVLGAASVVVGLGPLLQPAAADELVWIGGAAIGLGAVLLTGAAGLALRLRYARGFGIAGALAAIAIGALVAGLAVASLDACAPSHPQPTACQALVGSIGFLGGVTGALGIIALGVLRRAHAAAFRRSRRR
jgi:hypothetical protein